MQAHLKELESEAIFVLREVAMQFANSVILFSGGKDSILLSYLCRKAFYPAPIPFQIMHVDTGHNFEETIQFRDEWVKSLNLNLIVASVQEAIDAGQIQEEKGYNTSRNLLQTTVLLNHLEKYKFDAAVCGARRDEEKARAKERFFSHRDEFGQWNPKNQRAELWHIFNGRKAENEHFRVFPISNWTELDVWEYLHAEKLPLPSLYFAHQRKVFYRGDMLLTQSQFIPMREVETAQTLTVRFRTIGDISCTGAIVSHAQNITEVIAELKTSKTTERGTRTDDQRSDTAMEDRKKEGYF